MTALGPVAILGRGRAGTALAAALARVPGAAPRVWSRGEELAPVLAGARIVLVAVADAAVPAVAEMVARAWPARGAPRVVLHVAGALATPVLGALRAKALGALRPGGRPRAPQLGVFHPAVSLDGPASIDRIPGAVATLSGAPGALRAGRALARALGMRALVIRDARRPLLHMASVLAAGDLVALLGEAEDLLVAAGLRRADARSLAARLAAGALHGYSAKGSVAALTGPVARGDAATLEAHLAAVPRSARVAAALHRALALAAAERLSAAGRLDARALRRIRAALALAAPRR